MLKHLNLLGMIVSCMLASCMSGEQQKGTQDRQVVREILIDSIWAANGVSFDLVTANDMQFVAYFDRNRMMSVAARKIGDDSWTKTTMDNQLIWDSHNSVVLGVDKAGYIHVSGNMHADPMAYFRSEKPYDISTMQPIHTMTGVEEKRVTYPRFFNDKEGELYHTYRSGGSGDGDIFVNRFLPEEQIWERNSDEPLFEGVEENENRSAYHKWVKDANGDFHFLWLWRWTPMVETCHNLSYARTSDMKHWYNAAGEEVSLPFRPEDDAVMLDPTPSKGGMHNSRHKIIITKDGQPIIGYVKYDEAGLTQLYMAKFMNGAWMIKQISDWDFRWKFIEGGAFMTKGGQFNFVGISEDGLLAIDWETEKEESGRYTINLTTLAHSDKEAHIKRKYPMSLQSSVTGIADMEVRITQDQSGAYQDGSTFLLKYEALRGGFRQHRPDTIPEGPLSPLKLIQIQ